MEDPTPQFVEHIDPVIRSITPEVKAGNPNNKLSKNSTQPTWVRILIFCIVGLLVFYIAFALITSFVSHQ